MADSRVEERGSGFEADGHGGAVDLCEDVLGQVIVDVSVLGLFDDIFGVGGVDQGYGFGMRFGIGADFYATEQLYITPEVAYMLPLTEDINNYDYLSVSLGIGWAFN